VQAVAAATPKLARSAPYFVEAVVETRPLARQPGHRTLTVSVFGADCGCGPYALRFDCGCNDAIKNQYNVYNLKTQLAPSFPR
jgi:hypothetical protein